MRKSVNQLLASHGKSGRRLGDPKTVLDKLYLKENLSLDEIAELLGVTRPAVAEEAKKLGIEIARPGRKPTLTGRCAKIGHENVDDYFRANSTKTFEAMSKELGVSNSTIRHYYEKFAAVQKEIERELKLGPKA